MRKEQILRRLIIYIALLFIFIPIISYAEDQISLYNNNGEPVAYIDSDLTIYTWNGKPVAYLFNDIYETFHLYGFNGKHLGWLKNGLLYGHDGYIACATKERMKYTMFEPFKGFKQFKPFKNFREFAPFKPFFYDIWSDNNTCKLLLLSGSK